MAPRWSRPLAPARRPGLRVEPLEDRAVPAVTTAFAPATGLLTVTLSAPNDAATITGLEAGGTKIEVTGGAAPETFDGVTSVVVTDPGGNLGQQVTFAGDADGTIQLTGAVGTSGVETVTVDPANGPLRAASFKAEVVGTVVRLNNGVTTTGAAGQSYGGPVVVGGGAGLTLDAGTAGVTFSSTVNAATAGADGLTVNAGGATDFSGAVGGAAPLAALATVAAGSTILRGNSSTTGAQTFNDPVVVGAAAVLVSSSNNGAITFGGTVNGQDAQSRALTVETGGATTFAAAVGGTVPLAALTTNNTGTTALGGNVSTTGSQTYGDPVTLSGAAVALTASASGTIFFASTLDAAAAGGTALAVNTSGTTTFGGAVGGTNALASLTTDAAGSTVFGLAAGTVGVRTTGGQTYNDPARLAAAAVNFTSTANGALTFAGALNGTAGIVTAAAFTTGGATAFQGAVGATTPLASLTTDAAGTTSVGNNVTTTGNQLYADAVTVAPATGVSAVSFTSQTAGLEFAGTLGGASAAPVTLQAGTTLTLRDDVTFTANGSQVTFQAGASGTGTFSISAGVRVRADRQNWRAGDGAGGTTTAAVDLTTNAPEFRDSTDANAPRQFVFRQDAAVTDALLPAVAQFGGTPPADYKIISDDAGVTLNNGPAVAGPGTTALTLSAATTVSVGATINAPAAVVRLRAANGAITQTGGGITAAALAAQASAGVDLSAVGGNAAVTLAARASTGNVRYTAAAPFTVGVVAQDPVVGGLTATTGVSAAAGTVTFQTNGTAALDLTVAAPVSGTTVTATGGAAADRVTVNYTLAAAAGTPLPNGLVFDGFAGADSLTLSDTGSSAAHTYAFNNNVVRDGAAAITYTEVEALAVTGGDAADTFTVTPAQGSLSPGGSGAAPAGPALTLAGGLPRGATGDTLTLNPVGTPTYTTATTPDGISGTASFAAAGTGAAVQSVAFSQMEAVNPQADVRVTVTGPGSLEPGGTATYQVVVSNIGSAAANGVVVNLTTLTGLTNPTFTTAPTGSATASPAGGAVGTPLTTLDLPGNATVTITVTGTVGTTGTTTLTATASSPSNALDPNTTNNTASASATVTPVALLAVGAGPGGGPQIKAYNPDGTERLNFLAYDANYRGGVTVATGDVTGDGFEDVVTGSATGASHVKVFSGRDGALVASFFAFPGFTGGVNVAVANGRVVVGAGAGGGPVLKGFTIAGGSGTEVYSVLAYEEGFRGGVRVAGAGDLVSVGAGPGGGPRVRVFREADLFTGRGTDAAQVASFFAYPAANADGVTVGMGLQGATPVVIAGAGPQSPPTAVTFNALTGAQVSSVQAFDSTFRGGVRVAGATTAAGQPATALGAGPGGAPRVRIVRTDGTQVLDFFAFDASFTGGVYVG